MLIALLCPGKLSLPNPNATSKFPTKVLGEHIQCDHSLSLNGITHSFPAIGSLITPEIKLLAAAVGLPGLTEIVGNRNENPMMYPRRV